MNYIVLQHHYLLIRGIAIVHPRCSNPTIDFLIFNKRIAYFHTTENYLREKREKKKTTKIFFFGNKNYRTDFDNCKSPSTSRNSKIYII